MDTKPYLVLSERVQEHSPPLTTEFTRYSSCATMFNSKSQETFAKQRTVNCLIQELKQQGLRRIHVASVVVGFGAIPLRFVDDPLLRNLFTLGVLSAVATIIAMYLRIRHLNRHPEKMRLTNLVIQQNEQLFAEVAAANGLLNFRPVVLADLLAYADQKATP